MPTDRMISPEGYIVISQSPKARTVPTLAGRPVRALREALPFGQGWHRFSLATIAYPALSEHGGMSDVPNMALIPEAATQILPLLLLNDGYTDAIHKLETIVGGSP